jgi:hypothetical protein
VPVFFIHDGTKKHIILISNINILSRFSNPKSNG